MRNTAAFLICALCLAVPPSAQAEETVPAPEVPNQEIETLRKRVTELEIQLNDKAAAEKKGPARPWEIEATAGGLYFPVRMPSPIKTQYAVSARLSRNVADHDWITLGLELGRYGFEVMDESTYISPSSYYYTSYKRDIKIYYGTPQIRLQRYWGKYFQPFFSIGLGWSFTDTIMTYRSVSTYSFPPYSYSSSYSFDHRTAVHNFNYNANVGFNIGKKDGLVKATFQLKQDKVYDYLLIPSAGLIIQSR